MSCKAVAISTEHACSELLDSIEAYFAANIEQSQNSGPLYQTTKAPIFLQRPQHSLTVVGIARNKNGSRRLLVFDPAYRPPWILNLLCPHKKFPFFDRYVLYQYQRDERYLKRYHSFEILYLTDPAKNIDLNLKAMISETPNTIT